MAPAGTSNELDVQDEWEENTHTHYIMYYKGSGRGRLGAPRPPWRVRVECEEVFVLELSGTHELHTINTTYQVADVRPSGLR